MLEDVVMPILQILLGIGGLLAAGCTIMSLFYSVEEWAEKTNNSRKIPRHSTKFEAGLILGLAIIGWSIFFYNGAEAFLWFLPDSWGQDGEWATGKSGLAGMAAFILSCLTMNRLQKLHYSRIREATQKTEF